MRPLTKQIGKNFIFFVAGALFMALTLGATSCHTDSAAAVEQSQFSNLEFDGGIGGFYLFDRTTGDIWVYAGQEGGGYSAHYQGKLVKPGEPLAVSRP